MTTKLDGKVAVIFGAGSRKVGELSNGKAAAITYARAGAKVVAVDIHRAAVDDTAAAIAKEGLECLALAADAANPIEVQKVIETAVARFGGLDVLHNNVGIIEFGGHLSSDEAKWDRVMAVNVRSMFTASRFAIPHMVQRGGGSIINISALASVRYLGPAISYSTSKAAVNGLTQAIALEHARQGIRCNAILPGFINTPVGLSIYENVDPQESVQRMAYRDSKLPTGAPGTPWDIANVALFLASDESRYVNGLLIPVDGGVMRLSATAV